MHAGLDLLLLMIAVAGAWLAAGFADHADVAVVLQQDADRIARQRLVVDDDDAQQLAYATSLHGIDSDARTPPSALVRSNCAALP